MSATACGNVSCYSVSMQCNNDWINFLSTSYSVNTFPNTGLSALNVTVTASLLSFLSLSNSKVLDVVMQISYSWIDQNLPFPLSAACSQPTAGIQIVSTTTLWTPYLQIANPASSITSGSYINMAILVPTSAGFMAVTVYQVNELVTTCNTMQLANFPYDSQTCTMTIDTAVPQGINFVSGGATLSSVLANTAWDINNISLTTGTIYTGGSNLSAFNVTLSLSRNFFYYQLNIVYPTIAMGAMIGLIFILPCDGGEKVGLASTLVLGLYVLQQILSGLIPVVTNNDVPTVMSITMILFYLSVVALGEAVFVQTMCILSPQFPRCSTRHVKYLCVQLFRRNRNRTSSKSKKSLRSEKSEAVTMTAVNSISEDSVGVNPTALDRVAKLLEELLRTQKIKDEEAEEVEENELAWKRLQYLINFLSLIAYIIALCYFCVTSQILG